MERDEIGPKDLKVYQERGREGLRMRMKVKPKE